MKRNVREVLRERIADLISREEVEEAVIDSISANEFSYYIEQAMDDVIGNIDEQLGDAAREIAGEIIGEMVCDYLEV